MRASAIAIVLACVLLASCSGEENADLRRWVKDSEKLPHGNIPPLPEMKPYEPYSYNAFDLTDPFKPRKIEPPKGGGALAPDLNRRREPLEAYPLENLRMVGTLEQKKEVYALVRAPDNTLYRVKNGNYLGQNFGRIVGISESAVKIKEIVQDSAGNWEEKDQVLQLSEEQEVKR